MRGLNCGSGQRRFVAPTWINLDLTVRPPDQVPDVQADAFHLPFGEGIFDYVCLHHVLEHFGCNEAAGVIKECYRVLRMQGSLLVFVPDALELARAYAQRRIDDFIFAVQLHGAFQGLESDRHKWCFSPASLGEFLSTNAPWRRSKQFDWRLIEGADIARDWYILGWEAIK